MIGLVIVGVAIVGGVFGASVAGYRMGFAAGRKHERGVTEWAARMNDPRAQFRDLGYTEPEIDRILAGPIELMPLPAVVGNVLQPPRGWR